MTYVPLKIASKSTICCLGASWTRFLDSAHPPQSDISALQNSIKKDDYPTGRLRLEWNFVGGKEEGKWVYYYPEVDAGTRWEEIYVNGQLENKVGFYKNGNVWFEENYVDGSKHGKFIDYDEDGNIADEDIWENGECVEMCEGDE